MKLLKKDVLFQWRDSHEKEFQELKNKVSSDACLQYFDTTKPVTLQIDASKVELAAVPIQKDSQGRSRPVAFASKSLTSAETKYANIECEIVSSSSWLHEVSLLLLCQSDHKPLEDIHLKCLSDTPPRLKRLLLKIQPYNFVIKCVPGKWQMHSAVSVQMRGQKSKA